jgi:FkbM family methyltransferase
VTTVAARYARAWRKYIWYWVRRRVAPRVELTGNGFPVRVDLRDTVIARTLYTDGAYEQELQRLIEALDLRGAVAIDVGANLGLHSLILSRAVGPTGRVLGFEPEGRNYQLLLDNLARNGAANVEAHRCALGEEAGTARLRLNDENFGDHRVTTAGPADGAGPTQECPVEPLDRFTDPLPAGSVRFVKLDAQGYEGKILRGMTRTLERNPDVVLLMEVFPDGLAAAGDSAGGVVGRLRDLGFGGWEVLPHRLLPLAEPWAYDLIRDGLDATLLLGRDPAVLRAAIARCYGEAYARGIP